VGSTGYDISEVEDKLLDEKTANTFQEALAKKDSSLITEAVSDEVKVTYKEGENSETHNYIPEELISDFRENSASHVFFNLTDRNIEKVDDNTVKINAKLYNLAYTNLLYYAMINELIEVGLADNHFPADYPESWSTLSYYSERILILNMNSQWLLFQNVS